MSFRYDEIGNRLKAFRIASGLSADEIARRIGISRTALYRFERGELAKIETRLTAPARERRRTRGAREARGRARCPLRSAAT